MESVRRSSAKLAALVDGLGQAFMIHDASGRPIHATPGVTTMLAGEPRRRSLEAAVRRVAASLATQPRDAQTDHGGMSVDVDVGGARYRLRGSFAGSGLFDARETIVVLLERIGDGPVADALLSQRYRLTSREIEVARLLARGLTNVEVSAALAISPHTTKRHTESVLRKLGVRSRAAVAARLLGTAPASARREDIGR